jgi:hypothetical protein
MVAMRTSSFLLGVPLLVAAGCGSSGGSAAPPVTAPPTTPDSAFAAPAPAPTGEPVQAVPLTLARFSEGDAAGLRGDAPDRLTACMDLHVYDESQVDKCQEAKFAGSELAPGSLQKPWTSADLFALHESLGDDDVDMPCALVVAVEGVAYHAASWLHPCHDDLRTLARATWSVADLVPGGAPELVVDLTRDELELLDGEWVVGASTTFRGWCGVGASKVPACTPPVEIAVTDEAGKPLGAPPPPRHPVFP